jgi:hypothetical protein
MTKKLSVKNSGIIAICLTVLLLAGSALVVYVTASRPVSDASNATVDEDGSSIYENAINSLTEETLPQLEIERQEGENSSRQSEPSVGSQFREFSHDDGDFNVQVFSDIVDEDGNMITGYELIDYTVEELLAQRALEREQDIAEALARLEAGWQNTP